MIKINGEKVEGTAEIIIKKLLADGCNYQAEHLKNKDGKIIVKLTFESGLSFNINY